MKSSRQEKKKERQGKVAQELLFQARMYPYIHISSGAPKDHLVDVPDSVPIR